MTWILLRGLSREARHWGSFTTELAQQAGNEQVVALDLPGNGEFCGLVSPVSLPAMVAFARQQLPVKKLPPPYKLLAMSLGGMVATSWAQQHPQEVARLVLINTSLRSYSQLTQRLRPRNWPKLALLAARWRQADYAERIIHQLTCNQTRSRAEDLAAWVRIRTSAPVSAANAARQLWAAARFAGPATPPSCPVLVLSSAADNLVNPLCSSRLAAAWQAAHHQHPWAGHDLPHDDAAWVCRQLAG